VIEQDTVSEQDGGGEPIRTNGQNDQSEIGCERMYGGR